MIGLKHWALNGYPILQLYRLSSSLQLSKKSIVRSEICWSRILRTMSSRVIDDTQEKLLEEKCILVDENDVRTGMATKKQCHLLENIRNGMLHRAFSVFLFNTRGELLLQQRSDEKITFPSHFTNTCCSHPLHFEAELDEADAMGVRRAAQRKLKHELGIEPKQVPLDRFEYLTRIQYSSENVPADGKWGEHEIDYVLFIVADVDVLPNENEVKSYRYVNKQQLQTFLDESKENGHLVTPWFKLIADNLLFKWWENLGRLEQYKDHNRIHRL